MRLWGLAIARVCMVLLVWLSTVVDAEPVAPADPQAAIAQARQLLSSLTLDAVTSRYAQVGREYGHVVDGVRQGNATIEQLMTMRDITQALRAQTTARLKAGEAAAGESEAALEGLYRSMVWDDLSFALAAFPYWGAWIDLEIAKRIKDAAGWCCVRCGAPHAPGKTMKQCPACDFIRPVAKVAS